MKGQSIFWAMIAIGVIGATPARALDPATDVPRLWILASDGAVRHRDMVKPAMDSLINMGMQAVPYLLPYLNTEDARERHAITDIFKGIGSPAVNDLVQVLGTGGEYHTTNTLNALGKIGDPAATTAAIPFLHDSIYSVRSQAAETIGRTGGSHAAPALLSDIRDRVEMVRKSVVVGLGRLRDPAAADSLLALLDDSWYGVRYTAAAAVVAIDSGATASRALEKLEGRQRALLLDALGDARIAKAERWARDYLSDPDYTVRAAAARAIVRSKPEVPAEQITAMMPRDESNPLVKYIFEHPGVLR